MEVKNRCGPLIIQLFQLLMSVSVLYDDKDNIAYLLLMFTSYHEILYLFQ